MKKIFVISKKDISLAKEEVLSLIKPKEHELFDNILICKDTSKDIESRLGYSHYTLKFIFNCTKENLLTKIKKTDWNKIYEKNFCVRAHGLNEKDIADLIYHKLKNPKVSLKAPSTKFEFFLKEKDVIAGIFFKNIDKTFVERKAHLRPALHPTSMHPGLIRTCINLSGLKKGTLMDPFCGSGGMLIEAGLMGLKVIGYDFDKEQIERAKKNLRYYNIKATVETKDALSVSEKADAIVTDFPYGKSSKGKDLENLYYRFLKHAHDITKNVIVIMPDFSDYRNIVKKANWNIEKEFKHYVHSSLTRIILKLTPLQH